MAYECCSCGTRTEELRGVMHKGKPAGDYCHTCFHIGGPAKAYLSWAHCPLSKSNVGKSNAE